ncbi:hypothetical protein FA95DRAFT_1614249 [Auriscalpium vulgare]|uniref:Uncharacterized protein n=1 Tax=Auriscalpium vulgare TaxID=40419 RepID=A0ACB8R1B0_9AGAM|nr:hypothetical protein FA95DRAFT_1614249 [Auriscalpium vulgare]
MWSEWVPISQDDVNFIFGRAAYDSAATVRIRELALAASDLAYEHRTPRNALATTDRPTRPASGFNGGGRVSHRDRDNQARVVQTQPSVSDANTPDAWITVKASKQRVNTITTPAAPSTATMNPTPTTAAPKKPRSRAPAYSAPIKEWIVFVRDRPQNCSQGVPMHPDNGPLRGTPVRRLLERHLELRCNGPQGRDDHQRESRGCWVARCMDLFSIRGLYGRILYGRKIAVTGTRPSIQPYDGDTHNLAIEDVARHFAQLGYQPRSISITEIEEYATRRRNVIEGRSPLSNEEWTSSPRLSEMAIRYPPINSHSQSARPPCNLYPNMALDLRTTNSVERAKTPEGPTLSPSSGSMSPDFPAHYEPPTPYVVPLAGEVAGAVPPLSLSWADEPIAVNNIFGAPPTVTSGGSSTDAIQGVVVNNNPSINSAVRPADVPLPASRLVTPMDATE